MGDIITCPDDHFPDIGLGPLYINDTEPSESFYEKTNWFKHALQLSSTRFFNRAVCFSFLDVGLFYERWDCCWCTPDSWINGGFIVKLGGRMSCWVELLCSVLFSALQRHLCAKSLDLLVRTAVSEVSQLSIWDNEVTITTVFIEFFKMLRYLNAFVIRC